MTVKSIYTGGKKWSPLNLFTGYCSIFGIFSFLNIGISDGPGPHLIRWSTINDRSVPCVVNFRFIPRHRRIGMGVAVPVHSHLVRKMLRRCQPISSTEVHEDIHYGRHHHVCVRRADWWNGLHQWPQVCQDLPVRPRDEYNQ